jgi:hypothetical protein
MALASEWHLLSAEMRAAIMAIFYSSRKAAPNDSVP